MKIVFIITDYGSFNNFLGELARELVANDNEVHVICDSDKTIDCPDKYDYKSLGIHLYFVNFLRSFHIISWLKTSFKIKKIIAEIKPDVVNLHFTTGMFITFLSGRIKYPTIGVFHGLGFPVIAPVFKKFIFKRVEYFCFKKLDKILLMNTMDYDIVKKVFPQKALKYRSFGVGCDLNKFNPEKYTEADNNKLKQELNIQPGDFVLMYTGRFTFFKGFGLVIKAFKYIEEKNLIPDIKLILAGGEDKIHSTGLNGHEEKYLESSTNIIKTGFTGEVDKYLSISDLFVFPSNKEGMPVSIMEAIAMGVPVITFNSRGCNDIVQDNFNGRLLDVDSDHVVIAKAIVDLYANKQDLEKLALNALANRNDFDRNLFIKESQEIFKTYAKNVPVDNFSLSKNTALKLPEDVHAGNL
jgi:glycosyltransferase involved in cell wall biosynthesis